MVRIPNARLVQSSLYSGSAVFFILSVPVIAVALAEDIPGIVPWLGPTAIAIGGQHLRRLLRQANFELSERADALRIRHGLTELRATGVPLHRVQAAELRQPLLWRLPGWWQVRVNVAGVHGRDGETETMVVPVGTLDEALGVLLLIRPTLPRAVATAAMTGQSGDGFVSASRRARSAGPARLAAARVRRDRRLSRCPQRGAHPGRPSRSARPGAVAAAGTGRATAVHRRGHGGPRLHARPGPAGGGAPRPPGRHTSAQRAGGPVGGGAGAARRSPGSRALTRTRPVRMAMRVSSAREGLPEMAEALAETART